MDDLQQYFKTLKIEPTESLKWILRAYDKQYQFWHLKSHTDDPILQKRAMNKMKSLNYAYNILYDYYSNKSINDTQDDNTVLLHKKPKNIFVLRVIEDHLEVINDDDMNIKEFEILESDYDYFSEFVVDDFDKSKKAICDQCNSYVIPTHILYNALYKFKYDIEHDWDEDYIDEDIFDELIRWRLGYKIYIGDVNTDVMTYGDFIKLINKAGLNGYGVYSWRYCYDGLIMFVDGADNPLKMITEETAVIFDHNCICNKVFC